MVSTLVPMREIWSSTRRCAPSPSATIVITAATPMMMPSVVSTERIMLARMAASATSTISRISTAHLAWAGARPAVVDRAPASADPDAAAAAEPAAERRAAAARPLAYAVQELLLLRLQLGRAQDRDLCPFLQPGH